MRGRDARESEGGGERRGGRGAGGGVGEERRVAAWIGASIRIKGDLVSSEDMTIAGEIEGDIAVPEHTVVVAPRGVVRGNIKARAVVVHGTVLGAVLADRRVEVGETGSVTGDITAPRLAIAEGAALRGRLAVASRTPVAAG
jgi:cytoskeletal protein CcmA (bactofilin family)